MTWRSQNALVMDANGCHCERIEPNKAHPLLLVRDHLDDFLEKVSLGDDSHGFPSFDEEV